MNKPVGNIYNKLYLLLFGLLAFSIPIFDRFAAMAIVLIMFTWVIEGKFNQKFQRIKKEKFRRHILLFSSIYLIYLAGIFYSKNQYNAFLDLQTKLSLLVFPLLFATFDDKVLKDKKGKILYYYILGCFITTIVLVIHSFYNFFESYLVDEFFYSKLSWYQHASYLAMFLVFAIGILFYRIYSLPQNSNKKFRIINITFIIYFSILILLLSSKAGIISLLIIFLCHVGYLSYKKKYITSILMLLIYTLTLWGTSKSFSVTTSRLSKAQKAISSDDQDKSSNESTAERILIWESALSIIKENILFGVGTGDANDALIKKYKTNQYSGVLESRLNAHNQYLQTLIAIGIIGFFVLIGILFIPLYQTLRRRNILYVFLLSLITFNLLFESMFERQAGVVFYAFFNGLFFFYMFAEEKPD